MHLYVIEHCAATSMKTDGEAVPGIILAGQGFLVKMLVALEPHHIF